MALLHQSTTDRIIRAFYNVYNELGYGFLEKVYERALLAELETLGLAARSQQWIKVFYREQEVGAYAVDILVNDTVMIEAKAVDTLTEAHDKQLQNYLRATEIEVGLLLNFGPKPEFVRRIYTNNRKKHSKRR